MINVESFLQNSSGELVPIGQFSGGLPDLDYVEGSIEIIVRNQLILSREYVDYVDQLWAYFLNAMQDLSRSGKAEFMFPDMPVEVSIHRVSREQVSFRVDDNLVPRIETALIFSELCRAGQVFFERLGQVAPTLLNYCSEKAGQFDLLGKEGFKRN